MKRRFIHLQLTFVFACMLLFALTICSYAAEGFEDMQFIETEHS